MSNIKTHNKFSQFFKIFSLGMLLLLSPCSVRNSIQSVLQLEQTEVTSKSKTTQLSRSCNTFEFSKASTSISSKKQGKGSDLTPLPSYYIGFISSMPSKAATSSLVVNQYVTPLKVPLYILYKHRKDFIIA